MTEDMTTARQLLDAYAVGHEAGAIGCRGFNRRDHAPAAFAALRAVLDLCDQWRHPGGDDHPMGRQVRAAITTALGEAP